jgi:hypothetical protein
VLLDVLGMVGPEVLTRVRLIGCVVGERVELVIAHHGEGRTAVDHRPDDLERLQDPGAAVDEVAEEDGLTIGVAVDAVPLLVSELLEQPLEGIGMAMDIADEVVHGRVPKPL